MEKQGRKCDECGVWTHNGPDHICVKYDGPACQVCGQGTIWFTVGAPGYGQGRACKNNHTEYMGGHGILTLEQVR